jgi:hypothetical protein
VTSPDNAWIMQFPVIMHYGVHNKVSGTPVSASSGVPSSLTPSL